MSMIIPDPRFEAPELFEPGRPPTCQVVVDWNSNNTLLNGLDLFIVGHSKNLIRNTQYTISSSGVSKTVDGAEGQVIDITDGAINLGDTFNPGTGDFTVFQRLRSSDVNCFSLSCRSTSTAQGFEFLIGPSGVQGDMQFRVWTSSGDALLPISAASSTEYVFLCGVRRGNNFYFYVDGVEQSVSSKTGSVTPSQNLYIGKRGSLEAFDGNIKITGYVDRAYSAREIKSLYDNPYQFLIPA